MDFLSIYSVGAVILLVCMVALWLLSLRLRDASIVDIFWGTGFLIVTLFYYLATMAQSRAERAALIVVLVAIWGLRLSLHIGARNWGRAEDYRYANWRRQAGAAWWWRSLFKVFLLQGALSWIISAPLLAGQFYGADSPLGLLDGLAVLVWSVGFFFEAVGDWQLARFRANPANKGKLMDRGLWRYTRHPNYFGDAVQWWGFYLLSLAAGAWWTVWSPVLMTYLLVSVSGVAMLEANLSKYKSGYADYVRRTSAFIPWPPKRD
ncbi:MAG: DUF1295 domain-containing protein [Anaerolineae bacterium]|nr:DUF1295 domain-containing protein [Anaerolineae bacterium]MDW8173281.1 DUF1295 domain-containing protein [Anaerolineae bacterium]